MATARTYRVVYVNHSQGSIERRDTVTATTYAAAHTRAHMRMPLGKGWAVAVLKVTR